MTDRPDGATTAADPAGAIRVPPEAERAAADLAARVRAVAASLPFGADPPEFLAALERLAGDEEEQDGPG